MISQARTLTCNDRTIVIDLVKRGDFGHYMARYAGESVWHEIEEICQ